MENGSIKVHILTAEKTSQQIIRVLNLLTDHLNLIHSQQGLSTCFLLEVVSVKLNTEKMCDYPNVESNSLPFFESQVQFRSGVWSLCLLGKLCFLFYPSR